MLERRALGNSTPSYEEVQRLLLRLEKDRSLLHQARNRQRIVEEILNGTYTTNLPSSVTGENVPPKQVFNEVVLVNETDQTEESEVSTQAKYPALAASASDTHHDTQNSACADVDVQTEDVSTQDLYEVLDTDHDDGGNNTDSNTLCPSLSSNIQTIPRTQNDIEMTTDTLFDIMSFPDDASHTEEYNNPNSLSQDSASKLHQEGTEEQCQSETEVSSEDWIAGNKDKGKGRIEDSPPPDHLGYTPENPYSTWDPVELEPGHYVLTKPGDGRAPFDPSADPDLEDPPHFIPEEPTPLHLDTASQLSQSELVSHINDFLTQNASKLEVFATRKQRYSTTGKCDLTSIETELSPAWDNVLEINAITTAVLWLDALLLPFQRTVYAEDETNLRPQLEQAARDLYAIGDVSIEGRSAEKLRKVKALFDRIREVQASNRSRTELLRLTNLDPRMFTDLLSPAETIRYRRDLGRTPEGGDNLIDALRRIYRTVQCAVPVKLSNDDEVDEPTKNPEIQYPGVSFHPCTLPSFPEIFMDGYAGAVHSENREPLSDEYYHNMYQEMLASTVAQKEELVGRVKINKNPNSMNRDWRMFYDPIYKNHMRKYEDAARKKLDMEHHEAERQDKMKEMVLGKQERILTEAEAPPFRQSTSGQAGPMTKDGRAADPVPVSPNPSDCTDLTESSLEIELGDSNCDKAQEQNLTAKFCPNVNKPHGCSGQRRELCPHKHTNAGKICKKNPCTWRENCAFLHSDPTVAGPSQPTAISHDPRLMDLKPIISEVLANPKRYKVCGFVNKPQGCQTRVQGEVCRFNHTLEGVICKELQRSGQCSRGYECPLLHHTQHSNDQHSRNTMSRNPPVSFPSLSIVQPTRKSSQQQVHSFEEPKHNSMISRESATTNFAIRSTQDLGISFPTQPQFQRTFRSSHTPFSEIARSNSQHRQSLPPNTPTGPRSQAQQFSHATVRKPSQNGSYQAKLNPSQQFCSTSRSDYGTQEAQSQLHKNRKRKRDGDTGPNQDGIMRNGPDDPFGPERMTRDEYE
jgi:hypothetical protein